MVVRPADGQQLRVGAEDRRAVRAVDGDDDPRDQGGDDGGAEDQRNATATTRTPRTVRRRATRYRPERAPLRGARDAAPGARRGVLTQQQLADAAKLHRVTIARLEEGRQRPTAASLWKIARALRWPAFRVIRLVSPPATTGTQPGGEKASKALPSAVAWAGSVAAGGASCQAAARRLREVGDVVIVEDPEAGLGVGRPVPGPRAREAPGRARPRRTHWPRSAAARARHRSGRRRCVRESARWRGRRPADARWTGAARSRRRSR